MLPKIIKVIEYHKIKNMTKEKSKQTPEKVIIAKPEKPEDEIRLASIEGLLIGGLWIELDDAPDGAPPFRIENGKIKMDKTRLNEEKEVVKQALSDAISTGNITIFSKMTGGLEIATDEKLIEIYIELQKAFIEKSQNPFQLHSINVDLLTDGIAERNLIREGLKPQIKQLPFIFRDKNEKALDIDNDLDFIFVKEKSNTYKLIVGSKHGIDSIELPDDLENDKFQPDLTKVEKDPVTDAITIALTKSKSGLPPIVSIIDIRKGSVDIIQKAAREEALAQANNVRKRRSGSDDDQPSYTPSPPRSPRRSSESGGSGYTSVSG
jgi:hypothetical protein